MTTIASHKMAAAPQARMVGGTRRPVRRGANKLPGIAEQLNKILMDRKLDFQTSNKLPEVGVVEFFSDTENHKLMMQPIVRMSNRIHLVILDGELKDMTEEEKSNLTPPMIPAPSEDDNKGKKENKFQRKFKEQLAKICKGQSIVDLPDVSLLRLMIQRVPYIVNNPKVQHIESEQIVLVWGDLLMMNSNKGKNSAPASALPGYGDLGQANQVDDEGHDAFNGQLSEADFAELQKMENEGVPELVDPTKDGDVPIPDGATFTMNDVEMVMQQTGKGRQMVVNALAANGGDLIDTIMKLT